VPDRKGYRRLAWWLVWAYPPRFRRDVGLGLVDALEDRMRARRASGSALGIIWLRACLDTVRNASAEWIDLLWEAAAGLRLNRNGSRGWGPATFTERRTMFDKLWQDLRYAIRTWTKRPTVAIVGILTLAIGIGANTAMFSIVNAILLRPLPYAHADRIVTLWSVFGGPQTLSGNPHGLVYYQEYRELTRQSTSFDAIGFFFPQSVNLTGVSEPQRLIGSFVNGSFFDVLSLRAERGRLFTEEDSAPGTVKPDVVISHDVWQQRFEGKDSAIGQTMTLNGVPLTIIGVLAPPFDVRTVPSDGWFISSDVYLPVAQFPTRSLDTTTMLSVARLKPGATLVSAQSDLDVISSRLQTAYPQTNTNRALIVESAHESIIGSSRTALFLLLAAVGAVLLIACVNVSNLFLARAVDRQREIALRAALGASRLAVTRQMMVESALLAAVATAAGLVVGRWALDALTWLQRPQGVPLPKQITLDTTVLLFTGVVAIVVALVCGLAPAVRTSRPDLSRVLQAGFRRASATGSRTRDVLVVIEIALSVALVAICGLLVQSLLAVQRAPLGFDPSNVFTLEFRLPQAKYRTPEDIARFFRQAIERVRAVPGVQSAALVRATPFSGNWGNTKYLVEGRTPPKQGAEPLTRYHIVTPDSFRTLRIPLLRGRDFTDRDDLAAPHVAIVNETLARTAFPGEDPIGKHLSSPDAGRQPLTIIGVVGDAKHLSSTEPAQPQLYVSHYQFPLIFTALVARTSGPAMSVANDVRRAIWSVDKDQPMWAMRSLGDVVASTQGQPLFLATLLAVFAGIALLLAGVGIYGVMSYAVAQRTHEIGIRLALGASGRRVLGEVVARAARLTAAAVVIGLVAAIAGGRFASAVLFGVTPADPVTLAAAAIVLAFVSLVACYLPARRASRVDPVVALAEE
jgi:putative ABC transport system permease protein